jgi:PqqD family protein of HPr-rel-A system
MDIRGDRRLPEDHDGLSFAERPSVPARAAMDSDTLWRAPGAQAIAWRQWDDEIVVYNNATGSTHHLSPMGSAVLLALLRHPSGMETASLVRAVAEDFDVANMPLEAVIERTLTDLADLELAACSSA